MHGNSPFTSSFGDGSAQRGAPGGGGKQGVIGLHNLLVPAGGRLDPADMYNADGRFGCAPAETRPPRPGGKVITGGVLPVLGAALRKLRVRIEFGQEGFWTDRLAAPNGCPPARADWENPSIPSGYTYLLQLIAHDTVDSATALVADPKARAVLENMRRRPLMLDTIYGGGPDVCPSAYEIDNAHGASNGDTPRTRLRVGPRRRSAAATGTSDCPYRDIARATPVNADDGGLQAPHQKAWPSDALIADRRNDAHALMSQLTVLFHLLHNQLMAVLERREIVIPRCSPAEAAYRRFLAARLAVTLIYRQIIEKDVLALILHPDVHRHYAAGGALLDQQPGITLEFSHAAFRFGHAMVRDAYKTNSEHVQDMVHGIPQSSNRSPGFLPVKHEWLVDWARFFCTGTLEPNLSRRIGPSYPSVLCNERLFAPRNEFDTAGLPARDLMGACFAGIWSVPRLYARLQRELAGKPMGGLLPDYDLWRARLAGWLAVTDPTGINPPFEQKEIEAIADDPPLPFFVLFEAAHTVVAGKPELPGGGRQLGPVGSIIVAEALFGALRQNSDLLPAGTSLKERIGAGCEGVLNDAGALGELPEIETMPALLDFMAHGGAFAAGG